MSSIRRLVDRFFGRPAAPEIDGIEAAMAAMERGISCFEEGRFQDAIAIFTKVIEAAPGTAGIYHHRGSAYAESGRHDEAIVDYDVAVRLNPSYPDTYIDRGNSYHARDEPLKAEKDYSEALRISPNFAAAYANRAAVRLEMGDAERSEDDAKRARTLGIDGSALDALLEEARNRATLG